MIKTAVSKKEQTRFPMRKQYLISVFITILFISGMCISCGSAEENNPDTDKQWREYLGGPGRNHYSALKQINASNVDQLEVAWEYHTKDTGQIQCNPIIVDGVLYGMTATTQPFAVNAATGEEIWSKESNGLDKFNISRGLTYWEAGDDKRILYTTGEWLCAIHAKSGTPVSNFGDNGRVSLKTGLGASAAKKMVISTTPGTIYKDLIIMPLRVSEGSDAALGDVQAFNVKTGKLAWVFHTIPHPGEFGYDTWPKDTYKNTEIGGVNNWAGMAIDRDRGIIYIPTGSAAYDFYGANRKGDNLFANTLLALDANTGKRIWHFQLVHHDMLDRDPPAPPNLATINHNGKKIDVVVQVTKQGFTFVFDRETGDPVFPIEEKAVPVSDIPGEVSSPTQPFPTKPTPFARQTLTDADISHYAENRQELLDELKNNRSEGPFTPLSQQGTLVFPGLDGGAEWGGAAIDPDGVMYVNSNEMPRQIGLGPTATQEQLKDLSEGQKLYTMNCIACHGPDRKGKPASGIPALLNISNSKSKEEVATIIHNGKAMMPAFPKFSDEEMQNLTVFLFGGKENDLNKEPGWGEPAEQQITYQIDSYSKFLDSNGYPGITPPWGTLNAIDLNTGEYLWKIPYGEFPELVEKGLPVTGSENYGGPVVTASGLLFIAGTKDQKFRVYDKTNGELLWETELPAAAFATPSTYEVNGRQYIVMACGGTKLDAKGGDSYVSFALPR